VGREGQVSVVRLSGPAVHHESGSGAMSGAQGCSKWLFILRVIFTAGVMLAVRTVVVQQTRVEPALPVGPYRGRRPCRARVAARRILQVRQLSGSPPVAVVGVDTFRRLVGAVGYRSNRPWEPIKARWLTGK
jgi:hypothetical protein